MLGVDIEKLQRQSLKLIYGYKTSFAKALEASGLVRLSERREEIIEKFATKFSNNARFQRWFPTLPPYRYGLRNTKHYKEFQVNTDRLFKSPLFTFRRMLNQL